MGPRITPLDKYPNVPRPIVVDVRLAPPALLRRNPVVETREAVETYPRDPREITKPLTVLVSCVELTYPIIPRPFRVLVSCVELTYPIVPRPFTVLGKKTC